MCCYFAYRSYTDFWHHFGLGIVEEWQLYLVLHNPFQWYLFTWLSDIYTKSWVLSHKMLKPLDSIYVDISSHQCVIIHTYSCVNSTCYKVVEVYNVHINYNWLVSIIPCLQNIQFGIQPHGVIIYKYWHFPVVSDRTVRWIRIVQVYWKIPWTINLWSREVFQSLHPIPHRVLLPHKHGTHQADC